MAGPDAWTALSSATYTVSTRHSHASLGFLLWRRVRSALVLLGEMCGGGASPAPDAMTFNTAMALCGAAGAWARSLRLLSALRARRLRPTAVTYSTAMAACGDAGHWPRAVALFQRMAAEGDPPLEVSVFAAALTACAKGGAWERALVLLFEELPAAGLLPDIICVNAAMSACEKGGQPERALHLLDRRGGLKIFCKGFPLILSA